MSHGSNGNEERPVKMTTLYLRSDDAYRARVSETIQADGFFSNVYIRANMLVNEITNTMAMYEEGETGIPRSMGNNIILFTAARGQGKTSAMNTFASLIKKANPGEFFSENDCLKGKKYEVLGIIDPTMMNQSESIVRVFLSRLFSQFEEKVREEEKYRRDDSESPTGRKRIELLKLFSKCYDNVNFLESTDKNYMEYNDLDSLARLGSSTELRKNIKQLVRGYLDYVSGKDTEGEGSQQTGEGAGAEAPAGGETSVKPEAPAGGENVRRFLVLQIDDADLSAGNIFAICEQIREYLRIPGVIVLMAADFSQLRNSVFQEYLTQYKNLRKLQKRIEIVDTCYRKTWRYLEKMFPEGHRIYLPDMMDVLRNNPNGVIINYEDVVDGIEIGLNNVHCSDVQEQLIWLIYSRTGIVFMKNERGMKSLFPETLRQLTQFIMEIGGMKPVDHAALLRDMFWPENPEAEQRAVQSIETLQSNLERFYNYFFHEWVYSRVDKKVFRVLKEIIKERADTVKACRLIDGILKKAELTEESNLSVNYDKMNQSQGLHRLIEISMRLEKKKNSYERLTEAISLFYSIKMNEWFLEMVKYGRANRLLEFSNLSAFNQNEGTGMENPPLYYHFRIDYKDKRKTVDTGVSWADIFLSGDSVTGTEGGDQDSNEFYNKTFDVWNPLYNIMKLIPDKKELKGTISGILRAGRHYGSWSERDILKNRITNISRFDSHYGKWSEWDMLLGIRLIVTNVDIRSYVFSLLDEEKKAIEDNMSWSRRFNRLYRTFDQWHDSRFKFLELPESFHGLCNLAGENAPLSSFLFLANQKNYKWYCLAYARDIKTRYEKLISLIVDLQNSSSGGSMRDDGGMLRMDITEQSLWRITFSHDLSQRTEISGLVRLNDELETLNNEVLDALYGTQSGDTSEEQKMVVPRETRIEILKKELSDNLKKLSKLEKTISEFK